MKAPAPYSPGIQRLSRTSWRHLPLVPEKWLRWLMSPEGIAHREAFLDRLDFLDREEERLLRVISSGKGTGRISLGRLVQ